MQRFVDSFSVNQNPLANKQLLLILEALAPIRHPCNAGLNISVSYNNRWQTKILMNIVSMLTTNVVAFTFNGCFIGMRLLRCILDDVIKWRHFPRYWPFVRGIHRSLVNSTHKGQWRGALMFFFDLRLNERLSKQSSCWWFETPSRPLWRHSNGNDATFVTKQRQLAYYKACSRWIPKAVISSTWKYNGKTEPILIICYVIYTSLCYDIYLILIILWESSDLIW